MDQTYQCAGCGEENEVFLERAAGDRQELVEDCRVCCRPMVIRARWNPLGEAYDLDISQEDRD